MVLPIWSMNTLYKITLDWRNKEFDGVIVFDGNRGLGKSTGSYKLCSKEKTFDPWNDIVFSRDDIGKALSTKHKGLIFADEVINALHNRTFYDQDQLKIIKMVNMYRDRGNILICCVPNFFDLDKQFRNMVKIRVNVIRRGMAIIHTKNMSSYSLDKWDTSTNEKIEKTFFINGQFKPKYHKLTTARAVLFYGKLSKGQERLYKKIKEEKREKLMMTEEEFKKPKNIYDTMYEKFKEGTLDKEKLRVWCSIENIKLSKVYQALKVRASNENTTLSKIEEQNKLLGSSPKLLVTSNRVLQEIPKKRENLNRFDII